jgi:hypothetical protein
LSTRNLLVQSHYWHLRKVTYYLLKFTIYSTRHKDDQVSCDSFKGIGKRSVDRARNSIFSMIVSFII